MEFTYNVEKKDYYRETEYGLDYDGSEVEEVPFEPSDKEIKQGLTKIIADKYFKGNQENVKAFIEDLDEIEELGRRFSLELEDYFRDMALEKYYE